jgi:hypothetical protein
VSGLIAGIGLSIGVGSEDWAKSRSKWSEDQDWWSAVERGVFGGKAGLGGPPWRKEKRD